MVRDLDIERDGAAAIAGPRGGRRGTKGNGRSGRSSSTAAAPAAGNTPKAASAELPPKQTGAPASSGPAADLTPEDLVLKGQPKRPKRPRNKRHGRAR
jgi:hypothetical protein